jgi:hypothetical protein
MNRFALVGLGLVAVIVGLVLWSNQGARLRLTGTVKKVRLQSVDPSATVAVIDFRLANPADYRFVVKDVKLVLHGKDGAPVDGILFRQRDINSFFEFYKGSLGVVYNPLLKSGEAIASGASDDYMVAASFPKSLSEVEARMDLNLQITAVDGKEITQIVETR